MSNYYEIYADDILICSSDENPGILSPVIEKEICSAGSFSFTVLPTHPNWAMFKRMVTRIDVLIRGKNVFRGRVTEISSDFYKQKSITCEGALGWFVDNIKVKMDAALPNFKPYQSVIISELMQFNQTIESYKYFYTGTVEPGSYDGNLIPDGTVVTGGYFDGITGKNVVSDSSYSRSSAYILFEQSKTYKFYATDYNEESTNNTFIYLYDGTSSKNFLGVIQGHEVNTTRIVEYLPGVDYTQVTFIRVAGVAGSGDLFWLTTTDLQIDADDENKWDGGTFGDYLTEWLVNTQHMMIRSRVVNNANVLDVLSPGRNNPVAEIVFADNMLELSSENVDIEPYSMIASVFDEGAYYPDEFPIVEIPNAVALFGKIVKMIEFGAKPTDEKSRREYQDRINTLIGLYDATIPDQFTVKALDRGVIFDNDQLSIIDVGDPVLIVSPPHDLSAVLICLSMTLDIFDPSNNEYTIGKYVDDTEDYRIKTLTESFTKEKKK